MQDLSYPTELCAEATVSRDQSIYKAQTSSLCYRHSHLRETAELPSAYWNLYQDLVPEPVMFFSLSLLKQAISTCIAFLFSRFNFCFFKNFKLFMAHVNVPLHFKFATRSHVASVLKFLSHKKGKVVPLLNQLSTTPWRRMGEWMFRFTFSWPRH
jgi:hypothetical protein